MNVRTINEHLARGDWDHPALWPRLTELKGHALQFQVEFGLHQLPEAPGVLTIRGGRQYGKSTWLEQQLFDSLHAYGKGSAFLLNGDEMDSSEAFAQGLIELHAAFAPASRVKRLFIDEITAIPDWERALKRVLDQGLLRDVLIVTTGSKASDLRHGSERLPGRKGALERNDYVFLPLSYRAFHRHAEVLPAEHRWIAYLLTGGSPVACRELLETGYLPAYVTQLFRDWIFGEIVASGRSRLTLHHLIAVLVEAGGQPVGYAKLAREAGLANNTVAAGYLERLSDLLCVLPAWPWDPGSRRLQLRKPCKFHFVNTGALIALHPFGLRQVEDFLALPPERQGVFLEWLVAQELWRRSALHDPLQAESLGFWRSSDHEIDFVTPEGLLVEVKRGRAGPLDFAWCSQVFPHHDLKVICSTPFEARRIRGMTIEQFLLEG